MIPTDFRNAFLQVLIELLPSQQSPISSNIPIATLVFFIPPPTLLIDRFCFHFSISSTSEGLDPKAGA